jgi:hypothetical protein
MVEKIPQIAKWRQIADEHQHLLVAIHVCAEARVL